MRGRLCRIAFTALMGAGTLSGCAQMTRHSNTLVFGTNTSFGIKVGQDATATPSITVGYSCQEAVVMPLVANTDDDGSTQKPCPKPNLPAGRSPVLDASCILIGKQGPDSSDSYSVMASFGAKFGASSGSSGLGAKGEIAQYFATGLAARALASRAGAAAVSTSDAAIAASEGQAERFAAIGDARKAVADQVRGVSVLIDFLRKLDHEVGSVTDFQEACSGVVEKTACAAIIERGGLPAGLSVKDWAVAAAVKP